MARSEEAQERQRAYFREWQRKNPEKRRGYRKRYLEKNRDKISLRTKELRAARGDSIKAKSATYREKNRERLRAYNKAYYETHKREHYLGRMKHHLKTKYGLTPEQYAEMFVQQNGKCAICHEAGSDARKLHVDHCHETGSVRALLCYACNSGLGSFKDDLPTLEAAVRYMRKWDAKTAPPKEA